MKTAAIFIAAAFIASPALAGIKMTYAVDANGNVVTTYIRTPDTIVSQPKPVTYSTRSVMVRDNGTKVVVTKTFENGKMVTKSIAKTHGPLAIPKVSYDKPKASRNSANRQNRK